MICFHINSFLNSLVFYIFFISNFLKTLKIQTGLIFMKTDKTGRSDFIGFHQ
jgi:hypothetical protein